MYNRKGRLKSQGIFQTNPNPNPQTTEERQQTQPKGPSLPP